MTSVNLCDRCGERIKGKPVSVSFPEDFGNGYKDYHFHLENCWSSWALAIADVYKDYKPYNPFTEVEQ